MTLNTKVNKDKIGTCSWIKSCKKNCQKYRKKLILHINNPSSLHIDTHTHFKV